MLTESTVFRGDQVEQQRQADKSLRPTPVGALSCSSRLSSGVAEPGHTTMSYQRLLALFCGLIGVSGCSRIVPPPATFSPIESNSHRAAELDSQRQATARAELESQHLAKLRVVSSSDVLGLTEQQVVEKLGLDCLNPGKDGERWFSSGVISYPTLGGYLIEKHHVLTFADGRVIKY